MEIMSQAEGTSSSARENISTMYMNYCRFSGVLQYFTIPSECTPGEGTKVTGDCLQLPSASNKWVIGAEGDWRHAPVDKWA